MEIKRDRYLKQLIESRQNGFIKVVTGIRIKLEVDFIVSLGSKKYYVQSALSIPDREKEIQESRSLTSINDSFKKVIIVKDHIMPRRNEKGILTIGLFDFLLKEDSLDL